MGGGVGGAYIYGGRGLEINHSWSRGVGSYIFL